jgi:hypothetical protein
VARSSNHFLHSITHDLSSLTNKNFDFSVPDVSLEYVVLAWSGYSVGTPRSFSL